MLVWINFPFICNNGHLNSIDKKRTKTQLEQKKLIMPFDCILNEQKKRDLDKF